MMYPMAPYYHSASAPPEVTRDTLSATLHAAIEKKDVALARQALEESFWRKLDLVPDIFHLCRALEKQDKTMVRLLATYGARPQGDETHAVLQILANKGIDPEPLLKGTGLFLPEKAPETINTALVHEISVMLARGRLKETFSKIDFGKKAQEVLEKHAGLHMATAETSTIINDLHKKMTNDIVPPETVSALLLLKETDPEFALVRLEANRYLGKTAPGLAKTLLDLDIVSAQDFDMKKLSAKIGGEIKIFTAPGEKNHAYTEFICRVLLEIADAKTYVPLRGHPDVHYQQHFKDKWADNKNGFEVSYKLNPPKP